MLPQSEAIDARARTLTGYDTSTSIDDGHLK